jgi:uncharacterized protein YoaH (UPF0181 family)
MGNRTSYHERKAERDAILEAFVKLARTEGYSDEQIPGMIAEAGLTKEVIPSGIGDAIQKALASPNSGGEAAALIAAEIRNPQLHDRVEKARKGQQLSNDDMTARLRKARDERKVEDEAGGNRLNRI